MPVFIGGSLRTSQKFLGLWLIYYKKIYHFVFDDDCVEAFEILKKALISAPIVQPPDWNLPFEIMCDASDYDVGSVLGQRVDKNLNVFNMLVKL